MAESSTLVEEAREQSISLNESDLGMTGTPEEGMAEEPIDALRTHVAAAISKLRKDENLLETIRTKGIPWMGMLKALESVLPDTISDKNHVAYNNVPEAMDVIFGPQGEKWQTEKRPSKSGSKPTTWIVLIDE